MTRRQIAAFLAVCLLWGSTWAAIRIVVLQAPPLRVAALRFLAAGLLMVPVAIGRKMVFPRGRALRATVVFGLLMIGVQYALVFQAERYISSGLTAVLYAASPLVVGILSPRILKRPVPRAAMTAMLVGLGGLLMLLRSIVATDTSEIVPALVMLAGVLLSSGCSVYASRELRGVSAFASLAVQFLIGGSLLALLSAALERGDASAWNSNGVGALLFLIVFGAVAGFSLYFWLLQHVEPYRVITVQLIIPVISVIEGTLFLHERIPFAELCGGLVVLSAVVLVLRVPSDSDSYLEILPGNQPPAQ